ncbi:WG repeat-containing protein [Patescibacteria group bacterium]
MKIITIILSLMLSSSSIPAKNIDLQYSEYNEYVRQYCLEQEGDNIWYSYIDTDKNSKTYGDYGFKDTTTNEVMVPTQYTIIYKKCFDSNKSETYVAVRSSGGGWIYINQNGEDIVQAYNFDAGPDFFKEGLSRYVENGKVGFINENLEIVIPAQFDNAYPFENGFAKVCNGCQRDPMVEHSKLEGGIWGVVDKKGNVTWDKE